MFELSAGQIVAEKYRVDAIVGTGGMGVVAAATHLDLGQRVAIKFLREASPEALARFHREARLLVRLKSAHVARVFDVGELDEETPFIVMELLEGEDLGAIQKRSGQLPVTQVVDWVLEAICAIAEAHALGMVHRDLKPGNLFLSRGPSGPLLKVLDFGVSKILDDRAEGETTHLTNEGVALGSPGYMSPEQMNSSRDVDTRSDIFSLGSILYRLLSGQVPYKGQSVVSVLAAMAVDPRKPLREVAPGVPPELEMVVDKCLEQDRENRFPTVAHLAHALGPFASNRGRQNIADIMATMNLDTARGFAQTMRASVHPSQPPPASASFSRPPPARAQGGSVFVLVALGFLSVVVLGAAIVSYRSWSAAPPEAIDASFPTPTVADAAPSASLGTTPPVMTTSAPAPVDSAPTVRSTSRPGTRPPHGGPRVAPPNPNEVPTSRR